MTIRVALLGALLALAPLALATTSTVHERNAALLRGLVAAAPETLAQMPDGRILPAHDALGEAAARAREVDLARTLFTQGPEGLPVNWGDAWVIEFGDGPCLRDIVTPIPTFSYVGDPQFWMYTGYWGTLETTHGDTTMYIGWTTKVSGLYEDTEGHLIVGDTDGYCFMLDDGRHFAFPYANGFVEVKE